MKSGDAADARDDAIVAGIASWFPQHARDLPWRRGGAATRSGRDLYASLVSELMLQQTQVARVLEKFGPFMERFPTVVALANAAEEDVLAMWAGLGYYRRARLLHAAARACRDEHGGVVPSSIDALRALPGVGAYTAGAIASIVHHEPEPIVDGNVSRVLLRIEGRDAPHGDPAATRWAWARAGELAAVAGGARIAPFNEGLMELGATVCTPRAPACGECPVAGVCRARAAGRQEEIPSPKVRAARSRLHVACGIAIDDAGRLLVERRPERGLWAGMWAPPCVESDARMPAASRLRTRAAATGSALAGRFTHITTHREVRFAVHVLRGAAGGVGTRWADPHDPAASGVANAFARAIAMGRGAESRASG